MAKKFSFRLERLLNLRTMKVSQLREELNLMLAKRFENEKKIKEREDYLLNVSKRKTGKSKAENLQSHLAHTDFVKTEIKKLNDDNKRLKEIEDLKRNQLTEAMKEEKILIKLKEKKKEQYNIEINLEETKILDEIAKNIYMKNN